LSGEQVVAETAVRGLDTPIKTRHSLFAKPCRISGYTEMDIEGFCGQGERGAG
jgi:hypothetical protein